MGEQLSSHEVFGSLRPKQVHAISESSERIHLSSGDTVYEQGAEADHFFTVLEGEVALHLPGKGGVNVLIEQLTKGAMFGSCVCLQRSSYKLTARCTRDSVLLKVRSEVLKNLMEKDLKMGYPLQARISQIYFNRYIETMQKLQAIVMNIPTELA
jgi:CRP-like cAMP-binding protein